MADKFTPISDAVTNLNIDAPTNSAEVRAVATSAGAGVEAEVSTRLGMWGSLAAMGKWTTDMGYAVAAKLGIKW